MKHIEQTLPNLSFGNLAQLTVAKFNKIDEKLGFWSDDELQQFHQSHRQIRENHIEEEKLQATYRLERAERELQKVCLKK